MQCDFTKQELFDLDISIMRTAIELKQTLATSENPEPLKQTIERFDTLHKKLAEFCKEAGDYVFLNDPTKLSRSEETP